MYAPEQNVLTFGVAFSTTAVGAQAVQFEGSTKTMRKMKVGDTMEFIALSESVNTWGLHGVVQYFQKS